MPTKDSLPPTLSARALGAAAPLAVLVFASGFTGGSCGPVEPPRPLPPAPQVCSTLGEDACVSRGDCTAVYAQACACAACEPGRPCPPCGCDEPVFTACHANDPCAGLDEQACAADPMCEGGYVELGCPAIACAPNERCPEPVCPEPAFECHVREPRPTCEPVACRLYCEYGFAIDEDGCEVCACNPEPPPPPTCEPVLCQLYCEFGFAVDENGCEICSCNPEPPPPPMCEPVLCELYCEFGFAVDENGCEICSCNPPPTEVCRGLPERACASTPSCAPRYAYDDCATLCEDPNAPCPEHCEPGYFYEGCVPAELGCADDADCPNGFCEPGATCAGLNCPPPPPPMCVFASCDDGSEVLCDAIPPVCAPGQTSAVRNGCFDCVDARTCR